MTDDLGGLAERLELALVLPVHYDALADVEADSVAAAADVAGRGMPVTLDERSFAWPPEVLAPRSCQHP